MKKPTKSHVCVSKLVKRGIKNFWHGKQLDKPQRCELFFRIIPALIVLETRISRNNPFLLFSDREWSYKNQIEFHLFRKTNTRQQILSRIWALLCCRAMDTEKNQNYIPNGILLLVSWRIWSKNWWKNITI